MPSERSRREATPQTVAVTLFAGGHYCIRRANGGASVEQRPVGRRAAKGGVNGASRALLTGLGSAGPEVLDPIEDLVQCRFERRSVAVQLCQEGAAFDRGQERDG